MIELKNIDLSNVTLIEELNKIDEESKEFNEALIDYLYQKVNFKKQHLKEEFCDVIQAHLSLMKIIGIDTQEISEYWNTVHNEKIKSRPRVKEE